jgi:hypothetical protein
VRRRSIAGALGLALVLTLLPETFAGAEYRGTDMWANLVPEGPGGLADKHPISYFQLDYHVKGIDVGLGGVDANDQTSQIIHLFANCIFMILIFFMKVAISAFDWAFNVDIIGGRKGTLTPVGKATEDLWKTTFLPFLKTAILFLGIWFIYKLVSRKFSEGGVGILRAFILCSIALVIIFNTQSTVGAASALSKQLAGSIASSTTGANGGVDVSDRLFRTFIYEPWAVLNFGGLEHCVDWGRKDADGFPKQASALTKPGNKECRNNVVPKNGEGGYAQRFLRYPAGSAARKREYTALVNARIPKDEAAGTVMVPGITPNVDPDQFAGYQVDKADAPAVDMMQAEGALQRLGFVCLLAIGIMGAIGLLGLICLASLFAQVGLLACLLVTPVMALAAIFPATHGIFFTWAKWGGRFAIAWVMYAILLAITLGVSNAVMAFGSVSGYLPVFVFQGVLFGGLFIKRRPLVEAFTSRKDYHRMESKTKSFVGGTATAAVGVASAPLAAAGAVAASGKRRMNNIDEERQQAPAPKPSSSGSDTSKEPVADGAKRPDTTSPPASAGREYSPNQIDERQQPAPNPSTAVDNMPPADPPQQPPERGGDQMPIRTFREDYEKAKTELAHEKPPEPPPVVAPRSNGSNGVASVDSFADALKRDRDKISSQ